jgi:virulence factor Mce-like protein
VNGGLIDSTIPAHAIFENCGQGLRVRGDVKLRGVLVGRINSIEKAVNGDCKIEMGLFPEDINDVPANVGAQIRAKTVFGEKWVELLYPSQPTSQLAEGDVIPTDRTIDPLEVETILDTALPLLESVDPENLSATLQALKTGFVGHEEAVIRQMESGIEALRPLNDNEALLGKGIGQLRDTGAVFEDIDEELLEALDKLDTVQRFTVDNQDLIAENFDKVPRLLDELTVLFTTRFGDFTKLVDKGATVIGIIASRTEDLDQLLEQLPRFNAAWIRNLNHVCRYRQVTDEPGKTTGSRVPGRCWRVHNLISHSQGAYGKGDQPKPGPDRSTASGAPSEEEFAEAGLGDLDEVGQLLFGPTLTGPDLPDVSGSVPSPGSSGEGSG